MKRNYFERELERKGIVTERELSTNGCTVFVKIHCPFPVLCDRAEKFQYKMRLKETALANNLMPDELLAVRTSVRRMFARCLPKRLVRLVWGLAGGHETVRAIQKCRLLNVGCHPPLSSTQVSFQRAAGPEPRHALVSALLTDPRREVPQFRQPRRFLFARPAHRALSHYPHPHQICPARHKGTLPEGCLD